MLLNNAPVAIASSTQEGSSANREVPLDMFPSELFSQLSVAKTASADMLEGGAAGTINMRMARPFDREGARLTYQVQGIDNSKADGTGARGSLIASNTWGNFGALVGVAGVHNKVATDGIRDGRLGQHGADVRRNAARWSAVQHHRRQRARHARDSARQREHGRQPG